MKRLAGRGRGGKRRMAKRVSGLWRDIIRYYKHVQHDWIRYEVMGNSIIRLAPIRRYLFKQNIDECFGG